MYSKMWFYDIEQKPPVISEIKSSMEQPQKTLRAYSSFSDMLIIGLFLVILAIAANTIGWSSGADKILTAGLAIIALITGVYHGENNAKRKIERSGAGIRFTPKYRKYFQRKS